MNNGANNTKAAMGGKPYPEIAIYWNFYHMDEIITTNWVFYTYVDNLSFFGGLLDICLYIPAVFMLVYTWKLAEVNMFFYYQAMKRWIKDHDKKMKNNVVVGDKYPRSKYQEYILDNYGLISAKLGIYSVAQFFKLHNCCGTNLWQKKYPRCRKRKNDLETKDREYQNDSADSDTDSDDDVDIWDLYKKMDEVSSQYSDLQ